MASHTRVDKDEHTSTKDEYMHRIEDLAIQLYNETGIRMKQITLGWTQSDVPEADLMNDIGQPEFDIEVQVCDSQFM